MELLSAAMRVCVVLVDVPFETKCNKIHHINVGSDQKTCRTFEPIALFQ